MISDEKTNLSKTPGHESCLSSRFTRLDQSTKRGILHSAFPQTHSSVILKKLIHTNYSENYNFGQSFYSNLLLKNSVLGQTRYQPLHLFCSSRAGFPRKCFSLAKLKKNSCLQPKNSLRAFVGSSFPKSITLIYCALFLSILMDKTKTAYFHSISLQGKGKCV